MRNDGLSEENKEEQLKAEKVEEEKERERELAESEEQVEAGRVVVVEEGEVVGETVEDTRQYVDENDLTVVAIEQFLRAKNDETENRLGNAQITQLLKFCLDTYFTFDRRIYEQVKGTPMCSPISGLIAEAVL
nr:unnamed protein product [Spirometra erinaceieuropaei]